MHGMNCWLIYLPQRKRTMRRSGFIPTRSKQQTPRASIQVETLAPLCYHYQGRPLSGRLNRKHNPRHRIQIMTPETGQAFSPVSKGTISEVWKLCWRRVSLQPKGCSLTCFHLRFGPLEQTTNMSNSDMEIPFQIKWKHAVTLHTHLSVLPGTDDFCFYILQQRG